MTEKTGFKSLFPIVLIGFLLTLSACSSIPKPSDNFDGIVIIRMETTGDYNYNGDGRYIQIINAETQESVLTKQVSTNGTKYFRLREGRYHVEGFFRASNGDFSKGRTPKEINVVRGEITVYSYQLNRNFDRRGTRGFSLSNDWVPLEEDSLNEILEKVNDSSNMEYWELIY